MARNPDALALHAIYIARQAGHQRKALAEIQLAYELTPSTPALALQLGAQKLLEGDGTEACKWIDLAVANGYPRNLSAVREARAQLAMRDGRFDEAAQELTETLSPTSREAGRIRGHPIFLSSAVRPVAQRSGYRRVAGVGSETAAGGTGARRGSEADCLVHHARRDRCRPRCRATYGRAGSRLTERSATAGASCGPRRCMRFANLRAFRICSRASACSATGDSMDRRTTACFAAICFIARRRSFE